MSGLFAILSCLLLFPPAVLPQGSATAEPLPRGTIVEKVVCAGDATESYALYLPSGYSRDREWPILYAFDPGARGILPVRRFQAAAERFGYILAGSNNSRNGEVQVVQDAVRAIFADTEARFRLAPRRAYLAGFSGGARVAVAVGFSLTDRVSGVIACGAGFPSSITPSRQIPFAFFGTAGLEDFNYPELQDLDRTLAGFQVPHRFESFEGGHDWPPEAVCSRAVAWMEIQATKSGLRPKDDAEVGALYEGGLAEADSLEAAGNTVEAYRRYRALATDFAGLRDVSACEQKVRDLEKSGPVGKALATEKDAEQRQNRYQTSLSRLLTRAANLQSRPQAVQELIGICSTLGKQADQTKKEADRLAAVRVVNWLWVYLNEDTSRCFEQRDYGAAALQLELMGKIRPDNPQVYFHLARAYALKGNRKESIAALRNAVRKGFSDAAALEASHDFDSLKDDSEFRSILEDLRK